MKRLDGSKLNIVIIELRDAVILDMAPPPVRTPSDEILSRVVNATQIRLRAGSMRKATFIVLVTQLGGTLLMSLYATQFAIVMFVLVTSMGAAAAASLVHWMSEANLRVAFAAWIEEKRKLGMVPPAGGEPESREDGRAEGPRPE